MNNEIATWLVLVFFMSIPFLYAAIVFHDMRKQEQGKKKS